MLVLTRNTDESITIDGGIRITVVRIQGGRVRIGIEAPPETRVLRSELLTQQEPDEPCPPNESNAS